ncbi:transposable element Tcb1 transposase [Trichonephila clavipes]|nr:transposable element Tcb1 transposase [Trichonephila clavipes]
MACYRQTESGQTQRGVADAVGVARSVVVRLWNRLQETGNVRRRPGQGSGARRANGSHSVDPTPPVRPEEDRLPNIDWEQHDWSQVLFTDEFLFSLECDTRCVLYGGTGALEITPAFVRERSQYRRAGWMVWVNQHRRTARLVENMLEAETIQRMEFPACSPDLNPIEHVWDMLRRRIAARPRPPATVRRLGDCTS